MQLTDICRPAHEALRVKLALLREALPFAVSSPRTVQQLLTDVTRAFSAHAEREEILLAAARDRLTIIPDAELTDLIARHDDAQLQWVILAGVVTQRADTAIAKLEPTATRWLDAMEGQLAGDELRVLPALEAYLMHVMSAREREALLEQLGAGEAPAQDALRHAPMPMWDALWHSCHGLMVIDGRRRILAMNPAMEQLTGRRAAEVVGHARCAALFDCHDSRGCSLSDQPERCPGLKAMQRLRPVKWADVVIRSASGRRVPVDASYTPFRPDPLGPIWSVAIIRDTVAHHRLRRWTLPAVTAGERRRQPRVGLQARVLLGEDCGERPTRWHEGTVVNISRSGLRCVVPEWPALAPGDIVQLSLDVPESDRARFPYSRLAGSGRVVRLEPFTQPHALGHELAAAAIEFDEDLMVLEASAGNGALHKPDHEWR